MTGKPSCGYVAAMKAKHDTPKHADRTNHDTPETADSVEQRFRFFRDLRRRNERAAKLTQQLEARRRERTERALEVARQRRFRKRG
jgi:hypothetical protein